MIDYVEKGVLAIEGRLTAEFKGSPDFSYAFRPGFITKAF